MGIRIALHIRLAADIGQCYLVPFIFVSGKDLETLLLADQHHYAVIAVTDGSVLCKEDIAMVKANTSALQPIAPQHFATGVLKRLVIEKPAALGPHSLANEWGVYQLDRVAKLNSLNAIAPAYQRKSSLYFKYLVSINANFAAAVHQQQVAIGMSTPLVIESSSKRILYIDDEGSKGWTSALKTVFKNGEFVCITGDQQSSADFFKAIRTKIKEDWDLVLLDLRLLPDKEDVAGIILPIDKYSGTVILEEIKTINKGTQVVIFTASNKAWNMRQLMDIGADGYYIKESPIYLIPDALSLKNYENFLEIVKDCFEKKYLRTIFSEQQTAIAYKTHGDIGFLTLSQNGLENSFRLLNLGMMESAYLNYFQVIESYVEITFLTADKSIIDLSGTKRKVKTSNKFHITWYPAGTGFAYCEKKDTTNRVSFSTTLPKLSFIMAFKFGWDDTKLKKVAKLVDIRNKIAHKGNSLDLKILAFYDLIDIIKLFRSNT
jgi:DNA-binding NarL/FixJ family response regulator